MTYLFSNLTSHLFSNIFFLKMLNMAYPLIYNREQWAYLYIDWFVIIVQQHLTGSIS